jgi:hypothetical protein
MANTLNSPLADELRSRIDEDCGDGTLYATLSGFVREAILAGYQDAIDGRVAPFEGNLRSLLKQLAK